MQVLFALISQTPLNAQLGTQYHLSECQNQLFILTEYISWYAVAITSTISTLVLRPTLLDDQHKENGYSGV